MPLCNCLTSCPVHFENFKYLILKIPVIIEKIPVVSIKCFIIPFFWTREVKKLVRLFTISLIFVSNLILTLFKSATEYNFVLLFFLHQRSNDPFHFLSSGLVQWKLHSPKLFYHKTIRTRPAFNHWGVLTEKLSISFLLFKYGRS